MLSESGRRVHALEILHPAGQALEQGFAVGEVAVHGPLRHAGGRRDLAGGDLVDSPVTDQLGHGVEDELAGLRGLALP